MYPSKFRFISKAESPPNFSWARLGNGQRHHGLGHDAGRRAPRKYQTARNLRWSASRVSKRTDLSGLRRVEMGFR